MVGAELQVEKNRERRTGAEMGRACQAQGENLANQGSAATWVGDSCCWSQGAPQV